jgi:hypothetical protein
MLARYSAAALAVGATFFFKLEIEARVGEAPPFLLYLSAVTVSAWAGGLGPGPLTTLLDTIIFILLYLMQVTQTGPGRQSKVDRCGPDDLEHRWINPAVGPHGSPIGQRSPASGGSAMRNERAPSRSSPVEKGRSTP